MQRKKVVFLIAVLTAISLTPLSNVHADEIEDLPIVEDDFISDGDAIWYTDDSALTEDLLSPAAEVIDVNNDLYISSNDDLIEELDQADQSFCLEHEALLREKIISEYEKRTERKLNTDSPVYFICTENGMDYAVLGNDSMDIYSVLVSKKGEYFIYYMDGDVISDETRAAVLGSASTASLHSDMRFWNNVTLMYSDGVSISSLPRDSRGALCVPYFNQGAGYWVGDHYENTDWPRATFNINGHTMQQAGCGYFSTAMALSYIKQTIISPVEFKENGQYTGNGSLVTVGVETARMYGVNAYITNDWSEVVTALEEGHPVMANVGKSVFTGNKHFIMLVGYIDGMVCVNDPGHMENSYWYNGITFSPDTIIQAAHNAYWDTAFTIFG